MRAGVWHGTGLATSVVMQVAFSFCTNLEQDKINALMKVTKFLFQTHSMNRKDKQILFQISNTAQVAQRGNIYNIQRYTVYIFPLCATWATYFL